MKPAPFAYHAPTALDECTGLLAQYGDEAAVLAGGQSLIPLMRFRLAQPANIISIRRIDGALSSIRSTEKGVVIGASVTYDRVQNSTEVAGACPGLAKAIDLVAHPAVRTRGTICGNLCHADPASELPAMALVLGATLRLRSNRGERELAADDFFIGPYTTARRSDELLAAVVFPKRPLAERVAIKEITRLRGGFPLAGIAIALTRGQGKGLHHVKLACFGVHSTQIRVREAEAILEAHGYTPQALASAADAIDRAIEPHADPFASVEYRRSATRTLFRRAIEEAYDGTSAG